MIRLKEKELAPKSRFLEGRDEAVVSQLMVLDQNSEKLGLPKNVVTVVEADPLVKIIQF